MHPTRSATRGFTLVELVVVMTVITVIATVGYSRFASPSPFAGRAASDQLASALRSAQRLAVAQRQVLHVQVVAQPAAMNLCLDAGCTQPIAPEDGGAWFSVPAGVHLSAGTSYSIDGMGRPSFAAAQDFQPLDDTGQPNGPTVRIEAESGLVHLP